MRTMTFEAIGTQWSVESGQETNNEEWTQLENSIQERVCMFDKTYSRFRSDSLVSEISRRAGKYEFPADAELLFTFYRQLYDATDGKVTPCIGDLLIEAGYDAQYTLQPKETLHAAKKWDDVMTYEHPTLTVYKPVMLDFGAAGKGYLIDIVGDLMVEAGMDSFVIDASGDILRKTIGQDKLRVGLGHPTDPSQAIGVMQLHNGSICGSAINRRQWAGLHHVMDPDVAAPVEGIIATWAIAETALLADGMATALFLINPDKLRSVFSFEYCLVRSDYSFEKSDGLPAEIFSKAHI